MSDNSEKYICTACGHVAPYDDFLGSEYSPETDGFDEFVRCLECGAEESIQLTEAPQ